MDSNSPLSEEIAFSRSVLCLAPAIALFVFLSACAFYFTAVFSWSVQYVGLGWIALPIPLFFLPPFLVFIYIGHRLIDARFVIGQDYVRSVTGLCSVRKRDVQMDLENMRGIEVERGLWGRIVNCGDVLVVSTVSNEVEVRMDGVHDPSRYRDFILERKRALAKKATS